MQYLHTFKIQQFGLVSRYRQESCFKPLCTEAVLVTQKAIWGPTPIKGPWLIPELAVLVVLVVPNVASGNGWRNQGGEHSKDLPSNMALSGESWRLGNCSQTAQKFYQKRLPKGLPRKNESVLLVLLASFEEMQNNISPDTLYCSVTGGACLVASDGWWQQCIFFVGPNEKDAWALDVLDNQRLEDSQGHIVCSWGSDVVLQSVWVPDSSTCLFVNLHITMFSVTVDSIQKIIW